MVLRTAWAALTLAVVAWPAAIPAQEPLELKVKAAFLYNFARLTSWPPEKFAGSAAPLETCVFEQDSIALPLQQAFAGKSVDGHPLVVRRLTGAIGWDSCHIAYFGPALPAAGREGLGLAEHGVLTVHEGDAADADGVIRLFPADRKLRFEVNQAAAERAQLRLNARLMALAVVVKAP